MRARRFAFREPACRGIGRRAAGIVLATCLLVIGGRGGAGHSVGHFPSYYPDEIRIDVVDPKAAGTGLADATLHAYVGTVPTFAGPVPEHVKSVKSLGSILVLSFNAGSMRFASADDRCAAARGLLTALKEEKADGFVFHPYPVTPYHADYLHHLDRVEAAKGAVGGVCVRAVRESRRQGPSRRGDRPYPMGTRGRWRGRCPRGGAGR